MQVSSIFVIVLMWIVAFMGLGASCRFFDEGICNLFYFSLQSIFWTILGILAAVCVVIFGAQFVERKWKKEIDIVSGFVISFIFFWTVYGALVRTIIL